MQEGQKISDNQNSSLLFDKSVKKGIGYLSKFRWLGAIQRMEENNYWLNLKTRTKRLEICEARCIEKSQHTSHLLTPWCRVLPEQLTGTQLVKKFPAFHRTRRFITALTSVRHLSLSWTSPIQSIYPHPTSWRSILILSFFLLTYLLHGAEFVLRS